MDERDYKAMNKKVKNEIQIEHPSRVISIADINTNDLYVYWFLFENGEMTLTHIDKYVKNGKTGKTYKKEEYYNWKYKKTITNYDTGEFEEPKIPVDVWENAFHSFRGYLLNAL